MSPALRLRVSAVAGLLAFGLALSAIAQQPAPPTQQHAADPQQSAADQQQPATQQPAGQLGRIHGRVINPTGESQGGGTVSLSTDEGASLSYNFPVSAAGEYSGEVAPAEYMVIYRAADTPEGKVVDYIREVEVTAGQDTAQDVDMSRKEFMDRLTPEQQKQIEDIRAANAASATNSKILAGLDADFQTVNQDFADAANARAIATQALGSTATPGDVDSRAAEIVEAKYSEIQALMTKDTALDPDEPALWIHLAHAELGLKDFPDAETHYKKGLDLAIKAEKPLPQVIAMADAGLGEVYARTLMVDEANAEFDAAAKADPAHAAAYLENQAIIFFQEKNTAAQIDAADQAIKANPNEALLYYIKAQGLVKNAVFNEATQKFVLPPGCLDAYRKYLELAPTGPYAAAVTDTLSKAEQPATPAATAPTVPAGAASHK